MSNAYEIDLIKLKITVLDEKAITLEDAKEIAELQKVGYTIAKKRKTSKKTIKKADYYKSHLDKDQLKEFEAKKEEKGFIVAARWAENQLN